jgi:hypothetical protein
LTRRIKDDEEVERRPGPYRKNRKTTEYQEHEGIPYRWTIGRERENLGGRG